MQKVDQETRFPSSGHRTFGPWSVFLPLSFYFLLFILRNTCGTCWYVGAWPPVPSVFTKPIAWGIPPFLHTKVCSKSNSFNFSYRDLYDIGKNWRRFFALLVCCFFLCFFCSFSLWWLYAHITQWSWFRGETCGNKINMHIGGKRKNVD